MKQARLLRLFIFFFLMLLLSYASNTFANTPSQIGIKYYHFIDQTRNKPIDVEVWYPVASNTPTTPAKGIWEQTHLAINAPINLQVATVKNNKLPLIVISHGYKGSPDSLSWLATSLVKKGFVVLAAQHNDAGSDNKPYMEHWQRAIDVSFVLKQFQQTELAKNVDFSRVGMAGFSVGTSTGLWLAGGIASTYERTVYPGRQFVPEDEFPELNSDVSQYLLEHTDFQAAKKNYREPLIKSVFLMAPGYGWAFDAKQLSNITIPVYLVAAENDEMLYPQTNAYYFSKYIPNSSMKIIPDVGHFIFLNQAKNLSDKQLTEDDKQHIQMVNQLGKYQYTAKERNNVHQLVSEIAASFFLNTLK